MAADGTAASNPSNLPTRVRGSKLRDVVRRPSSRTPGARRHPRSPEALAARLIEPAGFEAVCVTGFGVTAARLGWPGIGRLPQMATKRRGQRRGIRLVPAAAQVRRPRAPGGPRSIGRIAALPASGPERAARRALLCPGAINLVFVDRIRRIAEVELVAR